MNRQREDEKARALEEAGIQAAEYRAFGAQTEPVRVLDFIRTEDASVQYEHQEDPDDETGALSLEQAKELLLSKDRDIKELEMRLKQSEEDQEAQFIQVKAKINKIVEQNYLKLKQCRRSYLELELKYTEATQLLHLLAPQDVRKSQPDGMLPRNEAGLLSSGAKTLQEEKPLAIKEDGELEEEDCEALFERLEDSQEALNMAELASPSKSKVKQTTLPKQIHDKGSKLAKKPASTMTKLHLAKKKKVPG